jgi:hypothetical protein
VILLELITTKANKNCLMLFKMKEVKKKSLASYYIDNDGKRAQTKALKGFKSFEGLYLNWRRQVARKLANETSYFLKKASIFAALLRPDMIALTTRLAPDAASPAAKTFSTLL